MDDSATIPFHLFLSSAALVVLFSIAFHPLHLSLCLYFSSPEPIVVVVVVLLFYVHGKHLRSFRDGRLTLTKLFLGRLRPDKRLTSTSCSYFR